MSERVITVDEVECYRFGQLTNEDPRKQTVNCTRGVLNGTIIRLARDREIGQAGDGRSINLCEFEVISCSDRYWGSGCDQVCGECRDGAPCDKVVVQATGGVVVTRSVVSVVTVLRVTRCQDTVLRGVGRLPLNRHYVQWWYLQNITSVYASSSSSNVPSKMGSDQERVKCDAPAISEFIDSVDQERAVGFPVFKKSYCPQNVKLEVTGLIAPVNVERAATTSPVTMSTDHVTECSTGNYGKNCSEKCGNCMNATDCLPDSGFCSNGCAEGFTGSRCTEVPTSASVSNDGPSRVALIVGSAAGGLALCTLITIVVIVVRRRHNLAVRADAPVEREITPADHDYMNIEPGRSPASKPQDNPGFEMAQGSSQSEHDASIYESVEIYENVKGITNIYTSLN
ncbi:hypothetical protein BaRGS_00023634 [Batillaria attramentaria]|uniref:Uncharacterized protein n=1 Tax=Batillaria attramentaria TaxID=370345 RepID=A0ABD0KD99_9CAEN